MRLPMLTHFPDKITRFTLYSERPRGFARRSVGGFVLPPSPSARACALWHAPPWFVGASSSLRSFGLLRPVPLGARSLAGFGRLSLAPPLPRALGGLLGARLVWHAPCVLAPPSGAFGFLARCVRSMCAVR